MNISRNTILITGGGSGIGRALAEAFHAKGNQIIVAGRRPQRLAESSGNYDELYKARNQMWKET